MTSPRWLALAACRRTGGGPLMSGEGCRCIVGGAFIGLWRSDGVAALARSIMPLSTIGGKCYTCAANTVEASSVNLLWGVSSPCIDFYVETAILHFFILSFSFDD